MIGHLLLAAWIHAALGQAQWRVVHSDGHVASGWGLPALATDSTAKPPARSIWVWSWLHSPVALASGGTIKAGELVGEGPFWLDAHVARRTRATAASARLVAAPVAMWRDLPESDLPSWPVPAGGRLAVPVDRRQAWRLRLVVDGEGSWWADVPAGQRSVTLQAVPTGGIDLTVLLPSGKPADKVHASVGEAAVPQGVRRTWALLAGASGRLTAAGLPDEQEVAVTLIQGGFPPLVIRGWPSRLPRQVTLAPGAEISGRVTDAARRAVPGARVEVESWVAQSPQLLRSGDKSKADGSFALRGLPPGRLTLTLSAPGYVPLIEPLELAMGERKDLGVRGLEPGQRLEIEVRDERGQPVPGAEVEAGPGLAVTADAAGHAELAGVPLAPLEIRGTASGHQPGTRRLQPPLPPRATLELRRGFTVRGRLLDSSGVPVDGGSLQIEAVNCSSEGVLHADGRFEEDVQIGKESQLVLRSPQTRELRLTIAPGTAGEARDLGDLTAPESPEVVGAVAGRQGEPVAGARIWLPRPGPQGPSMAWGAHDLVEARSGEDGRFRLSGLAPGPATLRVEAASYSRATLDVRVPEAGADSSIVDVGTITLGEGAVVRVRVDPARLGPDALGDVLARVDLRRHWLAADMLSAQVWNGAAEVPNVPPGAARVSVVAGPKILCEQEVEVPGGGEIDVDCAPGALLVTGQVLVGGTAAGPGVLSWSSAEPQGWARVDTEVSPTGLRRQQSFAAGRPQVDVTVEADGTFQTRDLAPGPWRAFFQPRQGSATPNLDLQIPPGERFQTVLPFAGLTLSGVVVTKDGDPAAGAKVSETASGALAIARPDGSFLLTGLAPGKLAIQARQDELSSAVTAVDLSAEGPPDPVRLVVEPRDPLQVRMTVLDRSGAPVAGAMVFFEEEGKG
ncbi:MAG: carboxypeptidase-like regulatory domain-containing protein, partial [Thermoanaerobaculia bacterium]